MRTVENWWLIKTSELPWIISRNFSNISISATAFSELAGSMGIMISASRKKGSESPSKKSQVSIEKKYQPENSTTVRC